MHWVGLFAGANEGQTRGTVAGPGCTSCVGAERQLGTRPSASPALAPPSSWIPLPRVTPSSAVQRPGTDPGPCSSPGPVSRCSLSAYRAAFPVRAAAPQCGAAQQGDVSWLPAYVVMSR